MAYGFGGGFAEGMTGGINTVSQIKDAEAKRSMLQQQQSQKLINDTVSQVDSNLSTLANIVGSIAQDGPEVEKIKQTYMQPLMQTVEQLGKIPGGQRAAALLRQKIQASVPAMKTMAAANTDKIKSEVLGTTGALTDLQGGAVQANTQQVAQAGQAASAPGTVNAGGFASPALPEDPTAQIATGPDMSAGPGMPGAQAAPSPAMPGAGAQQGMMQPPAGAQPAMQNVAPPQPQTDEYGLPIESPGQGGLVRVGNQLVTQDVYNAGLKAAGLATGDLTRKEKMDVYKTTGNELIDKQSGLRQTIDGAYRMQQLAESGDLVTGPGSRPTKLKLYGKFAVGAPMTEQEQRQWDAIQLYDSYAIGLAAARLKAFGSGSAVSDRDVEYALLQVGGSDKLSPEAIAVLTGGLLSGSMKNMKENNIALKRMGFDEGMMKLPKVGAATDEAPLGAVNKDVIAKARAVISGARAEGRELTDGEVDALRKLVRENTSAEDFNKAEKKLTGAEAGEQKMNMPKAGAVEDGYRFKGGDPSKQENWEKAN